MGRLIPGDGRWVVMRLVIFSIWSVTPLCWFYSLLFLNALLRQQQRELLAGASSPSLSLLLRLPTSANSAFTSFNAYVERSYSSRILFGYTLTEVLFTFYYQYLKLKIQAPGPKPLYGRRFLRYVFSRALEGGLKRDQRAKGSTPNGLAPALRKRLVPSTLELTKANGNDDAATSHSTPNGEITLSPEAEATVSSQEASARRARNGRLRAVSFIPRFVDEELNRDDERAKSFLGEYIRWFFDTRPEELTRRDVEHWLSWSLYGIDLDTLEEEDRMGKERAVVDKEAGPSRSSTPTPVEKNGPPRNHLKSPVPPSWTEPAESKRPILPSMPSSASTHSQHDEPASPGGRRNGSVNLGNGSIVPVVAAEPNEWTDPVRGSRLDFMHYCRELIEARQGFTLPEDPPPSSTAWFTNRGQLKRGPRLRTMRLTIDPVRVAQRPLLVYAITNTLSWLTIRKACKGGFKREQCGNLSYLIYRPDGWTPQKAKEDQSPRTRPLIFLHGLGIGVAQYLEVIQLFLKTPALTTRPILVPLQPHISQSIFSSNFLSPMGHHESTATLGKLFEREGWDDTAIGVEILGHSWGTIYSAWILKSFPTLVKRCCLVDPVCFQLWVPDVCSSFIYLRADTGMKLVLRYFVAREVGTAHTICRHFDWSSNTLWESEIPNISDPYFTRVFLAEEDSILSSSSVYRYLTENGMKDDSEGGGLFLGKGMVHGELLMHTGVGMQKIIKWLVGDEKRPS